MKRAVYQTGLALALFAALLAATFSPSDAVVSPSGIAEVDARLKRLAEREAALKVREDAFAKANALLEAKVRELEAARKGLEAQITARKSQDDERFKKMVKIYRSLKPQDAADLLNKLEPRLVIAVLDQMDQKSVIKLIPLITQPRVLEWTRLNLAGK